MQMPKKSGILQKFFCSISSIMKIGKLLDQLFTSHIHGLIYTSRHVVQPLLSFLSRSIIWTVLHRWITNEIVWLATWKSTLSVIPAQNRVSRVRKPQVKVKNSSCYWNAFCYKSPFLYREEWGAWQFRKVDKDVIYRWKRNFWGVLLYYLGCCICWKNLNISPQ